MREKLLVRWLGLDDATIEMTKLRILRSVEPVPIAEGIELRLTETDEEADGYVFAWQETASQHLLEYMTIPAQLYRAIQGNSEGWAAILQRLETDASWICKSFTWAKGGKPTEVYTPLSGRTGTM
ncbi:hypothetical protein N6L27_15165 [Leisingera sp. SS27]|uniref:hypothetical protein n=1 Tax=Leisingera sp. SS27 TaxID=2979462 RepID=UPI00232C4366|nr:hypothetical protein [Leisingera sp. SS27]MDC0659343.1 hypothetical protein [Leisingera sp. SS27]